MCRRRREHVIAGTTKDTDRRTQIVGLEIAVERIGEKHHGRAGPGRGRADLVVLEGVGVPARQGTPRRETGDSGHKARQHRHMPPDRLQKVAEIR